MRCTFSVTRGQISATWADVLCSALSLWLIDFSEQLGWKVAVEVKVRNGLTVLYDN